MADTLVAKKGDDKVFSIPPEGQYTAVCADIIDLGEQHSEKFGNWSHKCAIVFLLDETNPDTKKPFEMAERFTVSMNEKANLRKFLGQWRGKSYTEEEATAGAPLDKLVNVNALVQVGHNTSLSTGKTYANIISIMPLPKTMKKITVTEYERATFWDEVKKKARVPDAIPSNQGFEDFPQALEDTDDDLPF